MSAKQKNWSAAVTASAIVKDAEQFTRDTEVQVKLVTKPSREYIYELLTKMRFPLMNVEAIIERRANIVDFTCKNRESVEKLVQLLHNHPNVREARLFESEFVDGGAPREISGGASLTLATALPPPPTFWKRLPFFCVYLPQ